MTAKPLAKGFSTSSRVRAYTAHLARLLGCPPALPPQLEHAALLHDIGKIAVSDAILLKPAKLTEEEWVEMRKHSGAGEQILNRVSFLRSAAIIVRHHHERFDGTGYPDGLAREQIPLMGARIFAFADTLDAMTSDRHYRKAPGFAAVLSEVRRCIGTQFDPRIAEIFCQVSKERWKDLRARVGQRDCPPPASGMLHTPLEDCAQLSQEVEPWLHRCSDGNHRAVLEAGLQRVGGQHDHGQADADCRLS